ncbi:MAG TPA: hypothetical protein VF635_16980 [Propionibacteriaceae bacterium]|jgi:hypothetical protein
MSLLAQVLVLLHLVGFASLFGGALVQLRSRFPEVNAAMLHGAWTSLATGVALVVLAVLEGATGLPYAKITVKLVLTLFVVLLVSANRRYESIPRGLHAMIGGLALTNAGIAVLWQ